MTGYLTTNSILANALTIAIALVWLINGLFCKVLNQVPRHQLIVANILGSNHAALFTKIIGLSEVMMAIWILSNIQPKLCSVVQIIIVTVMNIIEFIRVPQLLLFGRMNLVIAILFIIVVYGNTFILPQFIKP